MKLFSYVAAAGVVSLVLPGMVQAQTSGIVLCFAQGSSVERARRVVASPMIAADLATQDLRYTMSPHVISMSVAEVPVALQVGVANGYAFYDREVVLGTDSDFGISGQRVRDWLGTAIGGCRLVAEMETCPRSDDQDFTVSCSDSQALETEAQEGNNF
ncbi:hypothetical protein [Pararhodobacter oceanensis]|uniref:Uncharacterized protein n=1 Tax=Pararhodobacter oceanensis TaxID=2172121 RepID=A0A2T8HXC2_9RHOB|nr:hypothetical protein [Pararhodobacter oceanensis]PVH30012.1 hypothetical protein DDE20_00020 [Pararhodobacter oceanensis]